MKRKVEIIKGPHFEQAKRNAQKYYLQIVKRYVDEGKYTKDIS